MTPSATSPIDNIFQQAAHAKPRGAARLIGLKAHSIALRAAITTIVLLVGPIGATPNAAQPDDHELEHLFANTVHPFLETYCFACHGKEKQEAKLDLSIYSTVADVAKGYRRWEIVLERLEAEEMPPEKAKRHPTPHERRAVIDWIRALRKHEAHQHADDPGPVLARRLSNAEYDYTIRDLTGVDIRPAREFPIDPANEAGFDNSGESLVMSPELLKKYLSAARLVADHLVLKPTGFVFAPHPVVTETDRDKYCVGRIIDFYNRQRIDLADYFMAAWRFRHRRALAKPDATLADFAAEEGISAKYLTTIWSTLTGPQPEIGPLAELQAMWLELPGPVRRPFQADQDHQADTDDLEAPTSVRRPFQADQDHRTDIDGVEKPSYPQVRHGCEEMRDVVVRLRQQLKPKIDNLNLRGISNGSQPLVLWKNRQYAANRMRYTGNSAAEPDKAALGRFCAIFPDAFYVSERGRIFLDPKEEKEDKGRLLSAGFHLMVGYFRDDEPLYKLILDAEGQRELNNLWHELNFITFAPMRQYKDFVFFERAEPPRFMEEAKFDFARSENKDVTSEAQIQRLAELYLAKAREIGGKEDVIEAIEHYFATIAADIRGVNEARLATEPSHLEALLEFAQRAYRRPLAQEERDELLAFYQSLREQDGLGHEEAMRDSIVSVLMSPHFCYRIDLPQVGEAASPLSDYALASRLSYFLWSSMPDAELMRHAAAGDLHRRDILLIQARRMLEDNRIRGLAAEFGGNWLDFRRFEEHNSVDRARFQEFTNELREAMYEEPIRFIVDVARNNRSVLDFLYAEHTFVNPLLARHYGMPVLDGEPNDWVRVDGAERFGRGGLLPMAVFLTKNAPGLRTSPVKRGYWVVRRLLGENIPPPPPQVPELPKDESKTGDLTVPQLLARHRENKTCAACHEHFDSIGLVFEGYGPIGERRDRDLGGRPVDTHASFPGGGEGTGLDDLRGYLREHRQEEFVDNLCRKLLAYALGRTLLLSDEPLVDDVKAKLAADDYRFGSLIESIVTSPQFCTKRGRDDVSAAPSKKGSDVEGGTP